MTVDEIKEKLEPFRLKTEPWDYHESHGHFVETQQDIWKFLVIKKDNKIALEGCKLNDFILGPMGDIDKFMALLPLALE